MRKKILVVDTDPEVLTWFRATQFRMENEFSYFFLDEEQRLYETVQKLMPDLIIMDINLANVSGSDLAEVLHHTSRFDVPIVYLSTEAWFKNTPKYPGMNFLPKPLTQKGLDQKIKIVLNVA